MIPLSECGWKYVAVAELLQVCVFDNLSAWVHLLELLFIALSLPLEDAATCLGSHVHDDKLNAVRHQEDSDDALDAPHLSLVQLFAHESLAPWDALFVFSYSICCCCFVFRHLN